MDQSVLEMAKELVEVQIQAGQLTSEEVQQALVDTHVLLMTLQAKEQADEAGVVSVMRQPSGAINWRKSITQQVITCLECGVVYKQLSKRHLREHGLTARSYRDKYAIPRTQPLAAKATTARRRKVVQETRPWEKTPRYLERQAGTAVAKKKAVAKRNG